MCTPVKKNPPTQLIIEEMSDIQRISSHQIQIITKLLPTNTKRRRQKGKMWHVTS